MPSPFHRLAVIKSWLKASPSLDPFRPFNHQTRTIFIHVPKCAGTSIANALYGVSEVQHYPLIDFFLYDRRRYMDYFKFAVLRDPVDRFISAFSFLKRGGTSPSDNRMGKVLEKFGSTEEFVLAMRTKKDDHNILRHIHFLPQSYFLTAAWAPLKLDILVKNDQLDRHWPEILKMAKLPFRPLQTLNQSKKDADTTISDQSIRWIRKKYQSDFAIIDQMENGIILNFGG